eukprot:4720647-Amphidinium_carterae.1
MSQQLDHFKVSYREQFKHKRDQWCHNPSTRMYVCSPKFIYWLLPVVIVNPRRTVVCVASPKPGTFANAWKD